MTGASSLASSTVFLGAGTKTFGANAASTSNFSILSDSGAVTAPPLLTIGGNYINNATFTHNSGTVYFSSTSAQTLSGTMTGASAFATTTFLGSGTKSFGANPATIGNFFIDASSGAVTAPSTKLTITGNFTNNATFKHNSGTTTLSGTVPQRLSGTMIGTSAFQNLELANSTASTTFANNASTTNYLYITTPGVKVEFKSAATSSFANTYITGAEGNEIYLFSATPGSRFNIHATGTKMFSYVRLKDSDACSNTGGLSAMNSTNQTNNVCWTFPTLVAELLHYRWRFDNGTEAGATAASQAEDTPLTGTVYVGDRRRLRIQVKNTGTGSTIANYAYRLEYAPGACSAWTPVGAYNSSAEDWTMDLSAYVVNAGATSKNPDLSTPAGTFVSGFLMTATNQTPAHSLTGAPQYTELEYSLRSRSSVTPDTTYCFRVTNAGSIANFTYTQVPQIQVRPNSARGVSGGSGSEEDGGGPPIGGGDPGGGEGGEGGGGGSGGGGDSE